VECKYLGRNLTCSFFLCFSLSFLSFSFSFFDFNPPPSSLSLSASTDAGFSGCFLPPLPFLLGPANTSSSSRVASSGALAARSTSAGAGSGAVGSSPSTKSSIGLPFFARFALFFFSAAKSPPPPNSSPFTSACCPSSCSASSAFACSVAAAIGSGVSPRSFSQSSACFLPPFFFGAIALDFHRCKVKVFGYLSRFSGGNMKSLGSFRSIAGVCIWFD
jgi:hypothetical protein